MSSRNSDTNVQKNINSAQIANNISQRTQGDIISTEYYTSSGRIDSLVSVGVKNGVGPESYSLISWNNTLLITDVLNDISDIDVSELVFGQVYLIGTTQLFKINRDKSKEVTNITESFYFVNLKTLKLYYLDHDKDIIIDAYSCSGKVKILNEDEVTDETIKQSDVIYLLVGSTGNSIKSIEYNGYITNLYDDKEYATIDPITKKIPSTFLPSYVDDVVEYNDLSSFPTEGESGKIYVALDTNITYRWGGLNVGYVEIGSSLALGETSSTAYAGDKGKALSDKVTTIESNMLSAAERNWVSEQLFSKLFTCTISASPSSSVFQGSKITVTYTLTTKYDGVLVDLDSIPTNWSKKSIGIYTKTGDITSTTGSSISSGSVACIYKGNTKTASSVNSTNIKYSYIYYSTATSLTSFPTSGLTQLQSGNTNTISGSHTLTISSTGVYVYFLIANTSSLSNVQQLGQDYLQSKTASVLTRDSYGTYKVYRSLNSVSSGSQTIVIS